MKRRSIDSRPDPSRRRFLEAAVATWLASVEHADAQVRDERVLGTLPFLDEGSFPVDETVGAGLGQRRALDLSAVTPDGLLTPSDQFFIRTGRPDRLPAAVGWKIRVHGLVGTPGEIAIDELRREAAPMGINLLECAGNSRAAHFGLMSAARFGGVKLERVLERFPPQPRATQVLVSGFDEHATLDPGSVPGASWIFGLEEVRAAGAFLATEMNGAPLGPDHGHPLRLVVPGWYACAAIKWVNEIALLDDQAAATDHMREYAGRTHQAPTGPRDRALMEAGRRPEGPPLARDFQPATIDPAAVPVRVEKWSGADGKVSIRIVGVLWGGSFSAVRLAPARALHIRLRPGLDFVPVLGLEPTSAHTWTLWSHTFASPPAGRYRIELAYKVPGVRTRRLDVGYYAREFEVTGTVANPAGKATSRSSRSSEPSRSR